MLLPIFFLMPTSLFEDQHDGVYSILETFITQTNTSHLPNPFDEKLFKTFLSTYLENILKD